MIALEGVPVRIPINQHTKASHSKYFPPKIFQKKYFSYIKNVIFASQTISFYVVPECLEALCMLHTKPRDRKPQRDYFPNIFHLDMIARTDSITKQKKIFEKTKTGVNPARRHIQIWIPYGFFHFLLPAISLRHR